MKATKPSDTITFGKYKGKTFDEISEINPSYILWLDKINVNIDSDLLSQCVKEDLLLERNWND